MSRMGPASLGGLYVRTECMLLWAVPLSFIVPAVWRVGRSRTPLSNVLHIAAFGAAVSLVAASTLGFPAPGASVWLTWLGRLAAGAVIVLASLGAAILVRSSGRAASLALIGGLATAAWMVWLRLHLLGTESGPAAWLEAIGVSASVLGAVTAVLMVVTAAMVVRARGRLFLLIIAVAFGYLSLQAIRNMNLFALAAGIVLSWNLGRWAMDMAWTRAERARSATASLLAGLAPRILATALVSYLIFTVVTGRFFLATAEPIRFGLRESPLVFAHDAARFAGQSGLPDRALVYNLGQAGVYFYHNGPERKVFIDPRLELAARETFATYVRVEDILNKGRPGWAEPLRRMGEPLVMLDHAGESVQRQRSWLTWVGAAFISTLSPRISYRGAGATWRRDFPALTSPHGTFAILSGGLCHRSPRASPRVGRCSCWPPRSSIGMDSPAEFRSRSSFRPQIVFARRSLPILPAQQPGTCWERVAGT